LLFKLQKKTVSGAEAKTRGLSFSEGYLLQKPESNKSIS
jgi:hypothetical protein